MELASLGDVETPPKSFIYFPVVLIPALCFTFFFSIAQTKDKPLDLKFIFFYLFRSKVCSSILKSV